MEKFFVAVTAIIIKDGKFLLTKRHPDKKRWPGKWTVPGGRLEQSDFIGRPTVVNNQWYDTLEHAVEREVWEETRLLIENIRYVCNIAIPDTVIVSYMADYKSGEIELQEDEAVEYAWVTLEEAKQYDLIDGIYSELEDAVWRLTGKHPRA